MHMHPSNDMDGPSLEDIGAARRHVQIGKEQLLQRLTGGNKEESATHGGSGENPVQHGLAAAAGLAHSLQAKVKEATHGHMAAPTPLPGATEQQLTPPGNNPNVTEEPGSLAAHDVRAHSPMELPSHPSLLPPATATSLTLPSTPPASRLPPANDPFAAPLAALDNASGLMAEAVLAAGPGEAPPHRCPSGVIVCSAFPGASPSGAAGLARTATPAMPDMLPGGCGGGARGRGSAPSPHGHSTLLLHSTGGGQAGAGLPPMGSPSMLIFSPSSSGQNGMRGDTSGVMHSTHTLVGRLLGGFCAAAGGLPAVTEEGTQPIRNIAAGGEVRAAAQPFLSHFDQDVADKPGSSPSWTDRLLAAVMPTARAVGAAAGTPTGTDGSQKTPTMDFGDNTSGRPGMKEGAGSADVHNMHGPGGAAAPVAHPKRAHTKDEEPLGKDSTPERYLVNQLRSTVLGGPEAAGIKRSGVDAPGGYEAAYGDLGHAAAEKTQAAVEGLPDTLTRVGESVGGVVEHVAGVVSGAVADLPSHATGHESVGATSAVDTRAGTEMSDVRQARLDNWVQEPEPARKRDTLVDKLLYPFSKDAGDPSNAQRLAESYFDYVEEKAEQAKATAPHPHDAAPSSSSSEAAPGQLSASERAYLAADPASVEGDHAQPGHGDKAGLGGLLSSAMHAAKDLGRQIAHSGQHAADVAGDKAGQAADAAREAVGQAGDKVKQAGDEVAQRTTKAVEDTRGAVEDVTNKDTHRPTGQPRTEAEAQSSMQNRIDTAADTVSGTMRVAGKVVSDAVTQASTDPDAPPPRTEAEAQTSVKNAADNTVDTLSGTLDVAAKVVGDVVSSGVDAVAEPVNHAARDVKDVANSTGERVHDEFNKADARVKEQLEREHASEQQGGVVPRRGGLLNALLGRGQDAADRVTDSSRDAADRMSHAAGSTADAGREAGDRARDAAHDAGDHARAAVDSTGAALQEGGRSLAQGIQDAAGRVRDAVVGEPREGGRRDERSAGQQVGDAARDVADRSRDAVHDAGHRSADSVRHTGHSVADSSRDSSKTAADNVKSGGSKLGDAVHNIGDRLARAVQPEQPGYGAETRQKMADSTRDNSNRAADSIADTGARAADTLRGKGHDAGDSFQHQADRAAGALDRTTDSAVHGHTDSPRAHAPAAPMNIIDSAALATGNAVEGLISAVGGIFSHSSSPVTRNTLQHTPPGPEPSHGHADRNATLDSVARPASFTPPTADASAADVQAMAAATARDPETGESHAGQDIRRVADASAGLAGRVVGTLAALFSPGGGAADDDVMRKDVGYGREDRAGMEPAGDGVVMKDHGGYGRGVEEVSHQLPPPPDIPVMPYTSTEELLKARAEGKATGAKIGDKEVPKDQVSS
ncbi:hypothetical protein QJQ45_015270 [Haematococcus lacustris]|nr:hypothetical protein QJQ45_015270 [Haematococcus lacustris]